MPRFYNIRCESVKRKPLYNLFDFGSDYETEYQSSPLYQKQLEEKLIQKLTKMVNDEKNGGIVQITLDYFQSSGNVKCYVENIFEFCMNHKSMIDTVTLNFYAITSVKEVGLAIKYEMYSIIDLHAMELKALFRSGKTVNETQLFNFYTFIAFLYFHFRTTTFERHHRLVTVNIDALLNLSYLETLSSLKLLTKLIQLNYKALKNYAQKHLESLRHEWDTKIINVYNNLRYLEFSHKSKIGRWLILAALDFSESGPILPKALNSLYKSKLQDLWTPFEWKIAVPMRAELSYKVIRYSLDRFDDIIDNFIEGTFCSRELL